MVVATRRGHGPKVLTASSAVVARAQGVPGLLGRVLGMPWVPRVAGSNAFAIKGEVATIRVQTFKPVIRTHRGVPRQLIRGEGAVVGPPHSGALVVDLPSSIQVCAQIVRQFVGEHKVWLLVGLKVGSAAIELSARRCIDY